MRTYQVAAVTLGLMATLSTVAQGQRATTWATPRAATELRMASGSPTAAHPLQADSLHPHATRATTGAIVGGVVGVLGGAAAFAHFVHRSGGVNNTTGTAGGALVGAGIFGGVGALVGLMVGSLIPR